jgi:hypothetical protein
MLQRDTFSLPIVKGMQTQEDNKLAQNDTFETIENWEFNKLGGLKKRTGLDNITNAIQGGGVLSKPVLLDTLKDELVCISDNKLYAYSPSQDLWVLKGNAPQAIATNTPILNANEVNSQIRMVEAGNYQIYLYVKSKDFVSTLYFSTIDKQTNTIITQDQVVSNALVDFDLVKVGSKVYVLYPESNQNIKYVEIQGPAYKTLGTPGTLVSDNNFSVFPDEFSAQADSTDVYLAYHSVSGQITVAKFNSSMSLQWTNAIGPSISGFCAIEINSQSSTQVCAVYSYDSAASTYFTVINKTGSIAISHSTLDVSYGYGRFFVGYSQSLDSLEVIVNDANVLPSNIFSAYKYVIPLSGAPLGRAVVSSLWICGSHGISINGDLYYLFLNTDPGQSAYMLYSPTANKYLAKFLVGDAESNSTSNPPQSNKGYPILSGTEILAPGIKKGVGLTSIVRLEADTDINQKLNSIEFHNLLNISGGITKVYDGGYIAEMGFHNYPYIIGQAASGGTITAGTYIFKATYSWTDKFGQYWESSPSNIQQVAVSGTQKVSLIVSSLMFTEKEYKDLFINIYMTQNNGTVYHLKTTQQVIQGDPTATIDIITGINATEQLLYTNGGVIENICPPPSLSFASSQNRLFIHSSDDKNEVWFSKEISKGYGIETTDVFVIRTDSTALKGDVEAIGAMDEKVIFFKQNSIYASIGQGPNNTGTQGDFSLPQLVMADVGCPYPRSVVITPAGLMFKSLKGIYTLGRGLQVEYTGVNMEAYNSEAVTSAQLMETKNQVRFTTTTRCMVFDYFVNAWTTFSNFGCEDSAQWNNAHVIGVGSTENLVKKQGSTYADNTSPVNTTIESTWIELKDLAGFQRINRMTILGEYKSPHTLSMSIYNNYLVTSPDTYSVPVSTDGIYISRVHIKTQKTTSFKFKLVESNTAPLGAGFTLAGFTFDVGLKKGLYKTPSSKQG